ncbi:chemotaxis protein CheY [Microbacterium sp.]|uniref:chemotaxis protein CheY n=1 Tax=unclassified Microbacterium TaxID=2609290 RepID=UPI00260FEF3F|nr:chemotaxis protein CheY [Microbacterium sp.]
MSEPIRLGWAPVTDRDHRREVAWRLVRELIGQPGIRISNRCPRCGADHGPVEVEGVAVTASVSYAAGWAVVALAPAGAGTVGVDAEPEVDLRRDRTGLTGVLGAGPATTRDWVRVEAALKADRRGLRVEPALVHVTGTDGSDDTTGASWRARVPGRAHPLLGWDLDGPPGVLVSAALASLEPADR